MNALRVFREWSGVDSPLGVYTKQNSHDVPSVDGCYAWFLPLWLYKDDLEELIRAVNTVLMPERSAVARLHWYDVELTMRPGLQSKASQVRQQAWSTLTADPTRRAALQETLLRASLLMPPLYIGRAKNLQKRYTQHVEGRGKGNTFYSRFREQAEEAGLNISVGDLLFVCFRTSRELAEALEGQSELEKLIEQILLQICLPQLSEK